MSVSLSHPPSKMRVCLAFVHSFACWFIILSCIRIYTRRYHHREKCEWKNAPHESVRERTTENGCYASNPNAHVYIVGHFSAIPFRTCSIWIDNFAKFSTVTPIRKFETKRLTTFFPFISSGNLHSSHVPIMYSLSVYISECIRVVFVSILEIMSFICCCCWCTHKFISIHCYWHC